MWGWIARGAWYVVKKLPTKELQKKALAPGLFTTREAAIGAGKRYWSKMKGGPPQKKAITTSDKVRKPGPAKQKYTKEKGDDPDPRIASDDMKIGAAVRSGKYVRKQDGGVDTGATLKAFNKSKRPSISMWSNKPGARLEKGKWKETTDFVEFAEDNIKPPGKGQYWVSPLARQVLRAAKNPPANQAGTVKDRLRSVKPPKKKRKGGVTKNYVRGGSVRSPQRGI